MNNITILKTQISAVTGEPAATEVREIRRTAITAFETPAVIVERVARDADGKRSVWTVTPGDVLQTYSEHGRFAGRHRTHRRRFRL